jgi:hypothetical protein
MRCPQCQEPIGVYEPVWVVRPDGSQRRGSVLTLRDELRAAGVVVLHESCRKGAEEPPLR